MLLWFGENPAAYDAIGIVAMAAFLAAVLAKRARPAAVLGLAAFAVLAWRWPVFFYRALLNPDEAVMLANGLKATSDPVPWRAFDPSTSGPLNSDILALPALVGAPIDFLTGRLIAALLMIGAVVALYWAVRWTYDELVGRLALVPPVLLVATVSGADYVHYSSEHLPVFLTTAALAGCAYLARPDTGARRRIAAAALCGAALGCIPYAKLQAVPIAAAVGAYLFAAITAGGRAPRAARREALVAAIAACAPTGLILGTVVLAGEWHDFVVSAIESNLYYVTLRQPTGLDFYLTQSAAFRPFVVCSLIVAALGAALAAIRRPRLARAPMLAAVSAIVLLAAALFAVYEPHKAFPHYLLLVVFPLAWLVANALGVTFAAGWWPRRERLAAAGFAALFAVPTLTGVLVQGNWFVGQLAAGANRPDPPPAVALARYAAPRARVAVWGWAAEYYVYTQTITASRDPAAAQEIVPNPFRDYYRARYMEDLTAHPPQAIVDAVAPSAFALKNRATQGIESFPALAAFVRERYALKDEVGGVRIFVAKQP